MSKRVFGVAAVAAIAVCAAAGSAAAQGYKLTQKIDIGGNKLEQFDIGVVDAENGRYYLADRSNAAVDVVDTHTNKLINKITGFVGFREKPALSGPDGVAYAADRKELYVGDGDSTVKIIDLAANPPKVVAAINTGGKARADELGYDPKDGLILVGNNADKPAFVSLISVKDRKVVGKVVMEEASDGVEQPTYVADTGMFYISVPELNDKKGHSGVAVFDPKTAKIVKMIPTDGCAPTGSIQGPGKKLLLGCDEKAPPVTAILDMATEKVTFLKEVGGRTDEVAYNPTRKQYFTASRDMTGGPVLGVINAETEKWVENLPTSPNAHSVAVDPKTNNVYVPLTATEGGTCPTGCIAVFQSK